MKKEPKLKPCVICGTEFKQFKSTQKVCSTPCAIQYAKQKEKDKAEKEWRKEKRERKEKLKSNSQHIQELQKIFNEFIRLRDQDKPCISCGKHGGGKEQAGHYLSVGSTPELRFNEFNVHGQCIKCNMYLSANLINYRKGLVKKIGLDMVEFLEGYHEPLKLTIPEIKELKEYYKKQIKELKG